jgi:hypothetical protein
MEEGMENFATLSLDIFRKIFNNKYLTTLPGKTEVLQP